MNDSIFTSWNSPSTISIVTTERDDGQYRKFTLVCLQGLLNKKCASGTIFYIINETSSIDSFWLNYYSEKLPIISQSISTNSFFEWGIESCSVPYYIIVDPFTTNSIDLNRTCTNNFAATVCGIIGSCVPVHPDDEAWVQSFGYTLLPDEFTSSLGNNGSTFIGPDAFDLRNQWTNVNPAGPWTTREDLYSWSLNSLLQECNTSSILLNHGNELVSGTSGSEFYSFLYDYSVGSSQYNYYFDPNPTPDLSDLNKTEYDYDFYNDLLSSIGPLKWIRGWHQDEWNSINIIASNSCFHGGVGVLGPNNLTVHSAVSQLFSSSYTQSAKSLSDVNLSNKKVYIAFGISDGDQLGVLLNKYYDANGNNFWENSLRGTYKITWGMTPFIYNLFRGGMNYFYETATSSYDYFYPEIPCGYSFFDPDLFGNATFSQWASWANERILTGTFLVPHINFVDDGYPVISRNYYGPNVYSMSNAIGFIDDYHGTNYYRGTYWAEEQNVFPSIFTSILAEPPLVGSVLGGSINKLVDLYVTDKPIFIFINLSNWYNTFNLIEETIGNLRINYEIVTAEELILLAKKAKLYGIYPLHFSPDFKGINGTEHSYLWTESNTSVTPKESSSQYRIVNEGGEITYKFNLYPYSSGYMTVLISGSDYQMDVSPDNSTWVEEVIKKGVSTNGIANTSESITVFISGSYLNESGCFYTKFLSSSVIYDVYMHTSSDVCANWHVSKNGNDNNNGMTVDSAWLTISHSVSNNNITAGDKIFIHSGVYEETVLINKCSGCTLDSYLNTNSGINDNVILNGKITATNSGSSWKFKNFEVSGSVNSGITISGTLTNNNMLFDNMKIYDCVNDGIKIISQDKNDIGMVSFNNCEIYSNGDNGINIYGQSNRLSIAFSSIHNNGSLTKSGSCGVYLSGSFICPNITGSAIYSNVNHGVFVNGNGIKFSRNYCHNNGLLETMSNEWGGCALKISGSEDHIGGSIIYRNLIVDSGKSGIEIGNQTNIICNNTIINLATYSVPSSQSERNCISFLPDFTGSFVKNNIVMQLSSGSDATTLALRSTNNSIFLNNQFSNNLYYCPNHTQQQYYIKYDNGSGNLGMSNDTYSKYSSCSFAESNCYRLNGTGSYMVINSGTKFIGNDFVIPTTDIYNIMPDIGYDEFISDAYYPSVIPLDILSTISGLNTLDQTKLGNRVKEKQKSDRGKKDVKRSDKK